MSESSTRLFPTIVSFCVSYVIHINVDPMSSFDMKCVACTSDGDVQQDRFTVYHIFSNLIRTLFTVLEG